MDRASFQSPQHSLDIIETSTRINRQCFKNFVRDSRRSENTPDTDSPGTKFAIYLINWCELMYTFDSIVTNLKLSLRRRGRALRAPEN